MPNYIHCLTLREKKFKNTLSTTRGAYRTSQVELCKLKLGSFNFEYKST